MNFVCTTCKRDVETPGQFCPFCGTPAPTPTPQSEDPLVGRKVGAKYFVHQRLGKGGMGLVYKATDVVLDRPLALKMLDRALLSDAGMVQRFHREARASSRLNHPNCITILDFGQLEDGQLFIAMEFLPGRPLTKLVAEEFPIAHGRVIRIGAQILAALAEAHAAGVIHRDLKLSNVMVEARRDEPDFVKVLDFGIAKLMAGDGKSELTTAGMICGTPGYMSPEQARGEELDARSDLYSVGIILYELLTGRLPFESHTPMALAVKHITETAILPSLKRPDLAIPAELDAVVMRALAKDREERFASAEEMRSALLEAEVGLGRAPVTPRPGSAPATILMSPTPGPGDRARPPSSAAAAPVLPARPGPSPRPGAPASPRPSAAASPRPATPEPPRRPPAHDAPPSPPQAAPSPPRSRAGLFAAVGAGAVVILGALAVMLLRDPFSSKVEPAAPEGGLTLQKRPGAQPAPPPTQPTPPPPAQPAEPAQPQPTPAAPPPTPSGQLSGQPQPPNVEPLKSDPAPVAAPTTKTPPKTTKTTTPKPPAAVKGIQQIADVLGELKVPQAATGQGLLVVNASPWGQAVVDGREIGETPKELRVGAGRYHVKVVHPTLGAREGQVLVKPGERMVFLADFSSK